MFRLAHSNSNLSYEKIILTVIIALGILARLWGIYYGLPHTECYPDEKELILKAVNYGRGDLNPHDFRYPSLYSYVLSILYGFYYIVGRILGSFSSSADYMVALITNPTIFFVVDRMLCALFGTLTIVIIYKVAKKLFHSTAALISALFMAFAYLHVVYSHFGVTDIPMTFLLVVSLYFVAKCHEEPIAKNYLLAGIFAGLATSTKYNALLLFIPMIITHVFNFEKRDRLSQYLDRRIFLFFIAMSIGFFMATPYAIFDSKTFVNDFLFNIDHLNRGHGIILGRGWWVHGKVSLFYGVGPIMLIFSILGIIYSFIKNTRRGLILFSFPIVYYLVAGKGYTVFTRYMMPVVPFICIGAAVVVFEGVNVIGKRMRPYNSRSFLVCLFAFLTIIYPVWNIVNFDKLISKKDTRLLAAEWIKNNVQRGSIICVSYRYGKVELPRSVEDWKKEYEKAREKGGRGRVLEKLIEHMESRNERGYRILEYADMDGRKETRPDFILLEESPLYYYSKAPDSVKELIRENYEIAKSFVGINSGAKDNIYDQQNAFYVPYANFKGVKRPGPNIYIYRLKANQENVASYQSGDALANPL
ncbi:MAG: glycosyltransferase family 39 protein [Candidatus Hodarchaeota archaeon]